jgi:hypothetical protein
LRGNRVDEKRLTYLDGEPPQDHRIEAASMGRYGRGNTAKQKRPKTRLGLPDLDHSKGAVLDSLHSRE